MKLKFDISDFVNTSTEQSVTTDLTNRFKKRRKECKLSQVELAKKSGVSYASIRRFESTGEISLASLIKLANAIGYLNDFDSLFSVQKIKSLKDYKNVPKR